MRTDERTGVQALERTHPGVLLAPGHVERRACLLSREVVSAEMVAPHAGPTRTEAAVLAPIQAVVDTDPHATRWHVVCNTLTMHPSETLGRVVAEHSESAPDVGATGERGILISMVCRTACVSDPTHQIVFHSTPTQRSWLNHIEIWLRLLVRTVLMRGSFLSVDASYTRVLAVLDASNRTMAKLFTSTSQGKALMADTPAFCEPQCTSVWIFL